jgi:hypothetical protein
MDGRRCWCCFLRREAARSRLQQRKDLGEDERTAAREAIREKRRQLNLQRQDLTTAEENARDAELARRERVKAEQARVARAAAARWRRNCHPQFRHMEMPSGGLHIEPAPDVDPANT